VLRQLIELLPHVSRLVPIAERYFSSKAGADRTNELALAALAEGMQADLGQVTKSHAGLYRQLQEQGAQITGIGDEVRSVRSALDASDRKIAALEHRVQSLQLWIRVGVSLMVVLLVVILVLLLRR
jgi:septal ring factor EnvC (AmiA/AmiB activator)